MRPCVAVLLLAGRLAVGEEPGEPAELPSLALRAITTHAEAVTSAQEDFVRKVQRADDALVRALDGELKKAVRGAREGLAVAIRKKIEVIKERDKLAEPFVDGSTPARAAGAAAGGGAAAGELAVGKEVALQASRPLPLGAVKAGDKLTLQYSRGVWTYRGGQMNSPDASRVDVKYRLVIFEKVEDGWAKLAIVDGGTAAKPWSYEFIADKADVRLGINDNPNDSDNVGEVVYLAMLQRKE